MPLLFPLPGTTNKPKPAKSGETGAAAAGGVKRGRGRPRKTDAEKAAPKKKAKKAVSTSESDGPNESSPEESDE